MIKIAIPGTFVLALGVLSLCPAAALAQVTAPGSGQAWPSKPIRMIVPFPAGGGTDFIARLVVTHLADRLDQQVWIDNRAGANGIVGLNVLKGSPPDGYTIALASVGPLAVNPHMYAKLPYDTLRDFAPVANIVNFPLLLVVHPSLPVRNVRELVALAKAKPSQLAYSSSGVGSAAHLAGELFNSMARVKILHVPYKGTGPAVMDTLTGQVQMTYSSVVANFHVRSGKLKALGVGNAQRVPTLPDIPTIAESGVPGYEAYAWAGMIAPANTPRDIIARLGRETVQILKQKDVSDRLLQQGNVPTPEGPEEFAAYIKAEIVKWGAVVKLANIKPE